MAGSLTLKNDLTELSRLSEWVQELGREVGLPSQELFHLDMSLEEIVTNVMKYAYGQGLDKPIELTWEVADGRLSVSVIDFGPEFNPLDVEAPAEGLGLDDMSIGGLGIHLTLKMMDRVDYRRQDGRNILVMVKKLAA